MKALKARPVTSLILLISLFILAIYALAQIPSREGFNPSDDGVILAQSYRILNGEIPHQDFLTIRPAGSAFMHVVHFFSPLPLELSARWLVLIEYLIYSILITFLLTGSWFKVLARSHYFMLTSGSVLVMFVLNQNHYNLFPWTTIDALLWFSIALNGWYRLKAEPSERHLKWQVIILFGVSCAMLCRQTFALPGFLLVIRMLVWEFGRAGKSWPKSMVRLVPALVLGLMPGWLYAGMLTVTGAWPDFLEQMTGRTEFWQTGVARFWNSFWTSPVLLLFGFALVTALIRTWNAESGKDCSRIDLAIMVQKFFSFLVKIILIFAVFLKPGLLFSISFAFFWILILDILLVYTQDGRLPRWIRPVIWILLVAWTSAISLGDNAPVFALGWLAGTGLLLQIKDFGNRIYRIVKPYQLIVAGVLIPSLVVLSMMVQSRVNYRDKPSKELVSRGGDVFRGLEDIRISAEISEYLGEIKRLYRESGSPEGRFAVWPNNALIYPLLGSRNPFMTDWMQSAEFAGNDERIIESTRKVLDSLDITILVERYNVKWIASDRVPVDFGSADYPYLKLLGSHARQVDTESQWFTVYRSR